MRQEHRAIIKEIQRLGGTATANQLAQAFAGNYYANGKKHVLNIVSTLVKNKQLIRVKPGLFKLNIPEDVFFV